MYAVDILLIYYYIRVSSFRSSKFKSTIIKTSKLIFLLIIFFSFVSCGTGSGFNPVDSVFNNYDWENLGGTIYDAELPALALDNNDNKFLAHRKSDGKVYVKKFDGYSWREHGTSGSMDGDGFISIASSGSSGLFLAYNSNANKIETGYIDKGGSWTPDSSIDTGTVLDIVVKVDKSGNRFLYYLNGTASNAVVYKGKVDEAFEVLGGAFDGVYSADFLIDSNDSPVIAYANDDGLFVKVWNGLTWSKLGKGAALDLSATTKTISGISLASSSNGNIYVAYEDWEHYNAVAVDVFNYKSKTWSSYPYLNFASAPSLKVNKDGMPILAVRDLSAPSRDDIASVYIFKDKKWQVLGRARIESSILETGTPISMEIDSRDVPVILISKGTSFSKSTSVLQLIDK